MKRGAFTFKTNSSDIRHEAFNSRDHLVVPVVAVIEQVLNGMLLPYDELSAFPSSWEGIPLPINHPTRNGAPVSANMVDVLQTDVVGRFHNATVDATARALKGELWIDIETAKAKTDGEAIINRLEAKEPLEVSTAYFCDLETSSGVFKNQNYWGIQRNVRPDHLALLPNTIGACSWADGCGAPRNNERLFVNTADLAPVRTETRFTLAASTEISHDEIARMIRLALDEDEPNSYHWLQDVYDDYVVYELEAIAQMNVAREPGLYKRSYSMMDGKCTLGDPARVRRQISYVEMPTNQAPNPNEGDSLMDKKQLVDALIANDSTIWKESHREFLMNLTECDLKKLAPETAPPTAANAAGQPAPNPPAPAAPPVVVNAQTTDQFLASAPPELRRVLQNALNRDTTRKAQLVDKLVANKVDFTKAELEAMELEHLEKLGRTVKLGVSYAGAPAPRMNDRQSAALVENDDDPPEPPKILTAVTTAAA